MALTPSNAKRADDSSGKDIKTGTDSGGDHIQYITQVDDSGDQASIVGNPSIVQGDTLSWADTDGTADTNLVVKTSPGTLFEVRAINTSSSVRYLHIFNDTSAPSGSDVPAHRVLVPASGEASESFGINGRAFSTGIVVAFSTDVDDYNAPASNEAYFHVGYI